MKLELIPGVFSVFKLASAADASISAPFTFLSVTDHEISFVCRTQDAPPACIAREDGFRALRVAGTLDFSLIGILAALTGALKIAGISVFAISTFDTDYLLVREDRLMEAKAALTKAGALIAGE